MRFFKQVLLSVLPDLSTAIYRKDEYMFKKLLSLGAQTNKKNELDASPLRSCLSFKLDKFCFELLEHGADPNEIFIDPTDYKKRSLLQRSINLQYYDQAILLVAYGADISYIKIPAENIRSLLMEAHTFYKENMAPYQPLNTQEAYQKLADAWQTLSEKENNAVFKECYLNKAESYRQKIQGQVNDINHSQPLLLKFKYH